MANKVYAVPDAIDREIARLKLESMKVRLEVLTRRAVRYLNSWKRAHKPRVFTTKRTI
jgi:adenosylhomocysteinase